MIKNVLIFLSIITIGLAYVFPPETFYLKQNPAWAGPKIKVKPSVITFFINNNNTSILINKNKVELQFTDRETTDLNVEKTMTLSIYPGDLVTINSRDLYERPGILAMIQNYDLNGKERVYYTDEKWWCNGKAAVILPNDAVGFISNEKGKWIWADVKSDPTQEVSCTFKIPCDK